jgi:hypothetical protein
MPRRPANEFRITKHEQSISHVIFDPLYCKFYQ